MSIPAQWFCEPLCTTLKPVDSEDQQHFSSVADKKPNIQSLCLPFRVVEAAGSKEWITISLARARARTKKPPGWELRVAGRGHAELGRKLRRQLIAEMPRCSLPAWQAPKPLSYWGFCLVMQSAGLHSNHMPNTWNGIFMQEPSIWWLGPFREYTKLCQHAN